MVRRILLLLITVSLTLVYSTAVWAKDAATPEITFQQALDRAKATSKTLQNASYDVDRSYEVQKDAGDNVIYIPAGASTPAADRAVTGLAQANVNYQSAKLSETASEDTVVMKVYQLYDGVLQAKEKVKLAQAQLTSAERKRMVAEANSRVGILDKAGLYQARASAESANSTLEANQKALDEAYQKFNQLVGFEPEDRPVLKDIPQYNELNVNDLETAVSRAVDANPKVWIKDHQINLAKLTLDLYNWNSESDPYEAKKIDLKKAEVSAGDTRDQVEQLVRTLYNTIKQQEKKYAAAQENVKVAEENLRVAQVKYQVGMVIEADVKAAEASLEQAKQEKMDILYQHDILMYAFSKPWAYAGSSAS